MCFAKKHKLLIAGYRNQLEGKVMQVVEMKTKLEEKIKTLEEEKSTLSEKVRALKEVVELSEKAKDLEEEVNNLKDEVKTLKDKIPQEFLQELDEVVSTLLSEEEKESTKGCIDCEEEEEFL